SADKGHAEDYARARARLSAKMAEPELGPCAALAASGKVLAHPLRPLRFDLDLSPAHVRLQRAKTRKLSARTLDRLRRLAALAALSRIHEGRLDLGNDVLHRVEPEPL